jgi:hypothetical protein
MPTVQWRTTDPMQLTKHEYWDVANRGNNLEETLAAQSTIGEDQLERQSRGSFRAGSL